MFNYSKFNSCSQTCDDCGDSNVEQIAKAVWEYLLVNHTTSDPPIDFGSLLKSLANNANEQSRILIE